MQREGGGVRALVERVHLGGCVGLAGRERLQQFLRLAFELHEVGTVAQRAGGRVFPRDMMSSFPGRALRSRRPVSAHSGRKEFIETMGVALQADAVLSADTEAP